MPELLTPATAVRPRLSGQMQGYPHDLAPGLHPRPSHQTQERNPSCPRLDPGPEALFTRLSEPLTAEALYIDDARPPVIATPKPHHVCGICFGIKSHPVSYLCGHSHCFVCIRVWLERQWSCPDCAQKMRMAPFRHYGEESSITWDYPFWTDDSRVSYSYEGLIFPRPPAPINHIFGLQIAHTQCLPHPEIKGFLESFPPSLVDLDEVFIKLGITTKGDLLDIAQWERRNGPRSSDFFAERFHKRVGDMLH
ncbi:hypothetical protein DFH08DRAFT_958163 [Mycena albidolilacea]|uniref:RING-type domain-containing protein n=1 Tax=Mycena albidolilacea TaxID=1033008 RepID=A0AAD7ET42_9AGAR|nr:hypothetical protein DFH08DRAFT_958163 [Mycena albidolilacea]